MLKPISVEVVNSSNFSIEKHPFRIGMPCPEGAVLNLEHLTLNTGERSIPFHATPLANWSDDSVKWLLLDFQASIAANGKSLFQLSSDDATDHQFQPAQLVLTDTSDEYLVDTGLTQFTVSKSTLGLFNQVVHNENALLAAKSSCIQLVDRGGEIARSVVSAISISDSNNALSKAINIEGYFQNSKEEHLANFNLKLRFYAGLSTVKGEFTLTNPRAAKHTGGVWDLGDSGSFFFKALSIKTQLVDAKGAGQSSIRITPDANWQSSENRNFMLEQYSSGGENWQSENHVNFKGEVSLKHKGFRYFEQGVQMSNGDRAEPCVNISAGGNGITAYIVNFWQNFPKGIEVDQSTLSLDLFPHNASDAYELQGGERKKHIFYLDFSNDKTSLDNYIHEITPRVSLDSYTQANVISWLPVSHEVSGIQGLINRGIQGENNFFDKREVIDEFGWRNFGEIFADHEQLEYKGNDQLISHYNNQYDPLYGFIKQYLVTGDNRWHELLTDLAQHIVDIDIYHTTEDRSEYNGGLFWHTHHYLKAFTCTHRTFSQHHAADFLYGEIGGGPGSQHCYTTGLSYYYFMTGDEVYKDAVLQLVDWVSCSFGGSETVIERIFKFKSTEVSLLKRLIAGEKIQQYKYPFDRGTGNYMASLIDAYHLTGKRDYLVTVEDIIQQSMHPRDDISLRNLEHFESSWSYLVYLQAVCKYLDVKIRRQEIDEACLYARDALLHYVDWMLEHETPFLQNLENIENVEYPNHTWTAQDLRKANLFYIASLYSEDKKDRYLEAAQSYVRFVEDTLAGEETRYYSRILILLMQNDLQESSLDYDAAEKCRKLSNPASYSSSPLYSISGILFGLCSDIGRRILTFSLKEERRWLSFRMK